MVSELDLLQFLIQYGIAGVVIYMLFKLINNDMKEVKQELREIRLLLEKLLERLAKQ
jgi:hypothetical protein